MKKRIALGMWASVAFTAAACCTYPSTITTNQSPAFASPEAMQAEFLKRFLNAPGFGFRRVLVPDYHHPAPHLRFSGQLFVVKPPQLIGMEEHPRPVAYELPFGSFAKADLTNTVLRSSVKTRHLNPFEAGALARLERGEDMVLEASAAQAEHGTARGEIRILALGAIRATADCLDCHSGREGKLLGAFSYVLAPVERKPATPQTNSVSASASARLAATIAHVLR